MDKKLKILVVGGHPADVFDHCGGTLAHHVRAGDSVTCLALTQGLRIHDEVVSEKFRFGTEGYTKEEINSILQEREAVKYQEVKDACALFGITDVRFLSYDDKTLQVTEVLIDAVAKVMRDVKPDLVITHYPKTYGSINNHHGNAAKICIAASQLAGTVDFDDPNPAWRIAQFAYMLNPGDTMAFNALSAGSQAVPNLFVDVTDMVELKVKALDTLRSQQYQGEYARKNVESWNGVFGFNTSTCYCEAFVVDRPEVSDRIHVCDHWYIRANEPELNRFNRDCKMVAPFVPMPE